ncbi:S-4TM family putative pore-forming effector [Bathymodiolus platifrons methanotrophic gill symbiont]|uniref:S-4TM family putative pore-forming effector n=1 Tax=Bathymodiolus platifrons methanotrophic gill symbiont TaxID=113268 RepID=UPI001C8E1335|nr:S-4TM family putative pore-forming effector [Bathymodiolus platifrons methanotrophic gill symbiont]
MLLAWAGMPKTSFRKNSDSPLYKVKSILDDTLVKKYSNNKLKEKSIPIQNEIFNYRKNNFLVFDWYYKKHLESKEEIMIDTVNDYIKKI